MPSGEEEVRSQRHDFIKEYYKMATLDLDRHLKGGWQAIAILAGGAAVLTAGHEGKIGLPIASALALATATWAALTCIDANFWSLRAIAFLSNVEAIYFSADDRKYFNPYIGRHPQFKLLNSLKYIFWLSLFFGAATLLNLLWEMSKRYPRPGMIIEKIRTMGAMQFALWGFPELVAAWGILLILIVSRNLLGQYIQFTTESPGPGVRTNARELRHVTLEPVARGGSVVVENDTHSTTRRQLDAVNGILGAWKRAAVVVVVAVMVAYAALVLYKAF